MSCSSCGSKKTIGNGRAPRGLAAQPSGIVMQAQGAPEEWVDVIYMGPAAMHFIHSPTLKVPHYGYGRSGSRIRVHPEDVRHSPSRFFVATLEDAVICWEQYPIGAPQDVVDRLGLPDNQQIPEPVYVPDVEEIPFSDDTPTLDIDRAAPVVKRAKRIRKKK